MRLGKSLGLAAGLVFATTVSASAFTLTYAGGAECDGVSQAGTISCGTNVNRQDPNAAIAAGGDFFSLGIQDPTALGGSGGIGGSVVFQISPAFSGNAIIAEVTSGNVNHNEEAEVYFGTDANPFDEEFAGVVGNGFNGASANESVTVAGGPWTYIGIRDVSRPLNGQRTQGSGFDLDGFDLDGIALTAVPVPAPVLMLGAAILGLGALRRKS